jgi:hypothetical protein
VSHVVRHKNLSTIDTRKITAQMNKFRYKQGDEKMILDEDYKNST